MYDDVQLSSRRKTKKTLNFKEAAASLIVHMHADYRKFEFSRGLSPLRLKVRGARAPPAPVVPTAMVPSSFGYFSIITFIVSPFCNLIR